MTIGTDEPAYEPWFVDNDPTNAAGFESAVAYAVAEQTSIAPDRAKVVDFSQGYSSAAQAVIALEGSPAAEATSLADLKDLELGAQTGTTSLTALRDGIQPSSDPLVFQDPQRGRAGAGEPPARRDPRRPADRVLHHGRRGPEGHDRRAAQARDGAPEEFGLLFEKGNALVPCVDRAIDDHARRPWRVL